MRQQLPKLRDFCNHNLFGIVWNSHDNTGVVVCVVASLATEVFIVDTIVVSPGVVAAIVLPSVDESGDKTPSDILLIHLRATFYLRSHFSLD